MAFLKSAFSILLFSSLSQHSLAKLPPASLLTNAEAPERDYAPRPSGIPFTVKDNWIAPWLHVAEAPAVHQPISQSASCSSANSSSGYWYEHVDHNGQSSFLSSQLKETYSVFRNVVADFGADNSGKSDASQAIQNAINAGAAQGPARSSHKMGTTGQPAVVYLPSGIYQLKSSLQIYVGTVIMGDPTNPPILRAAPGFSGDHIVYGKDPYFQGTVNFYIGFRNVVLDSTQVDPGLEFTLLDWTVSQATQLTNVVFNMPSRGSKHVGVTSQYDYNSNIIMSDLTFNGGSIGMHLSGQQWVFRNLKFKGTTVGAVVGGTNVVFLGGSFEEGDIGIKAHDISGSLTVIDSTGNNLGTFITSYESNSAGNAIILENIQNTGSTVNLDGNVILSGNVPDTWVHGTLYPAGQSQHQRVVSKIVHTSRSPSLVAGNKYFTMPPPTYHEFSAGEILNIKSLPDRPVKGDGQTDDTKNINAILAQNRDCKVIYFPAGTYIVTDTIFIPAGSRIVGDPFASTISAVGSNFKNPSAIRAMVRVGYPGDMGVAQISDMLFTVADILPGCQMVEVNIAGKQPGDVGFWNSHFRIGGAAGSKVESQCTGSATNCKAAWGLLHLGSTSSAYIENMWGWTADHDLDGQNDQVISTGRGLLVEATAATWLVGTGFEHHTLYQYNFHTARNVFSALQQSETPYWQGPGNVLAPAPWENSVAVSDPDFSKCAADDAICRMALFEQIVQSSDLFLYGGCNWAFFNNNGGCNGACQENAIKVLNSTALYLYGTNTKSITNMILEGNSVIATEAENSGGWGGVIAGFLYDS
ncbi:pectate lyase superfamily protein-domain-containing protein [Aspergillus ambiguus]|uniref:glycoside hydrolase family 55 protein n=1 Tax=Aspergillus ambiguus TaxID=176160 RepID=UPI003CCD9B5B